MTDIYNYIFYKIDYFFDTLYLDNYIYNLADKYYFCNDDYNIDEIIKIYDSKIHKISNNKNLIDINRNKLLHILKYIKKYKKYKKI